MFSLLTAKPLLIAVGVLSFLLAASSALNVRQWKQIGAAHAECELDRSNDSANRSQATTDAAAESLRHQVAELEGEINRGIQRGKELRARQEASDSMLGEYRKQLNEARKADPSLDQPADTSRLRALEDAYRVRAQGNSNDPVPSNP